MKIDIPKEKDAKVDFDDSMELIWVEEKKQKRCCYKTVAYIALVWFVAAFLGGLLALTFLADQAGFVHYKFYVGAACLGIGISLTAFGLAIFYLGLNDKPPKDDDVIATKLPADEKVEREKYSIMY